MSWRAEDERLLRRVEDELAFARLWSAVSDGAPDPHPRAAGLVAELRPTDEGAASVEAALRGDLTGLLRAVGEPPPSALTGPLAHHLALFHARLAEHRERAEDPARRGAAEWARLRSLAMWLWLAEEGAYLRELTEAVVAGGLAPEEVARVARDAPFEAIGRLGARALGGARELSEPARIALRTLARVGEASALAAVGERVRDEAERRARRARSAAIDAAVERVDHALAEARGREASTDELVALLADGAAVWRWADRDDAVEHFLVDRITPFCWDRYRERRWDELRALLRPVDEAVEQLATRVETDERQLAYASACAQMFVFRAEVAAGFEAQLQLAERAVALCSTHRNGRLVLANLLVERGLRALDVALPWGTGDALEAACRDVRRAAELFPGLARLADAKQRLKALGRDLDAD